MNSADKPPSSTPRALEGKAVIITGSARGLGAAYARHAAREGARVVVNGTRPETTAALAATLVAAGGEAIAVAGDVTDWDFAQHLVERCVAEFGRIDAVCNNAGTLSAATPLDQDPAEFRRVLEINLYGAAWVGMAAARAMQRQGTPGAIVNTVSGSQWGLPGLSAYGAAKGAVASLTYGWALDLAPHGIRVNAISPRAETRGAQSVQPGANQGLSPDGVAPFATFLMSERSHRFNGQVFSVAEGEVALISHPAIASSSVRMPAGGSEELARAIEEALADRQLPLGRSVQRIELLG